MNLSSTKFWHAIGVQIIACIALFTKHLTGAEWIAATSIALTVYSVTDVIQKKVANG